MDWPIHEIHQLSILNIEIGDSFVVRRTLQRLDSGELTVREATETLKSAQSAPIGKYHYIQSLN